MPGDKYQQLKTISHEVYFNGDYALHIYLSNLHSFTIELLFVIKMQ